MITISRRALSITICLFSCTLGCNKRPTTTSEAPLPQTRLDACTLLENSEIEAVQGSPVRESKSSANKGRGFRVSQCFYSTVEFSKSVSLTVTQRDPANPSKRSTRDYWEKMFDPNEEKERGEKENREKEEDTVSPSKKIDGIGEDARWTGMRFGAALYVLKKDSFIRISIGGGNDEESRLNSTKALALKAIGRL